MQAVVVPYRKGIYASFPTFVEHRGFLFVYYREGIANTAYAHGLNGKVLRLKIKVSDLERIIKEKTDAHLWDLAEKKITFNAENELDSIVSKLDENLFSLCTRNYIHGVLNQCYVSFNDEPEFSEREPVSIKGVSIHAFYGKSFKSPHGYVFPAYGAFEKDGEQRPLLLVTDTKKWDVLSFLPAKNKRNRRLNECSVVHYKNQWHIFIREDEPPYGIWWSVSDDLVNWTEPEKIVDKAHAPMGMVLGDEIIVAFRYLMDDRLHAVGYVYPFCKSRIVHIVDTYRGNMFDGGYCDLGVVNNKVLVVYYLGNEEASPYIKMKVLGVYRN
jgi:hypothetical protein